VALSEPHLELMKLCFKKIKDKNKEEMLETQVERKEGVPQWKYNLKNQQPP
jgi:hypothetical protein